MPTQPVDVVMISAVTSGTPLPVKVEGLPAVSVAGSSLPLPVAVNGLPLPVKLGAPVPLPIAHSTPMKYRLFQFNGMQDESMQQLNLLPVHAWRVVAVLSMAYNQWVLLLENNA